MAKRALNRFIRTATRRGPTLIQQSRAESSEQKAIWHNVTGAGRSRVKRPFLDLGPQDEPKIGAALEKLLAAKMARGGA